MIEELVILTQIIFIDIILAADNAIIIGLIAANFVPKNRRQIILWGVGGDLIFKVIQGLSKNKEDNSKIEKEVQKEIIDLCSSFPIYGK